MELYKKYRPQEWNEVVGNEAAVRSLRGMVEGGELPQAVLLHGPSGCGKTTLARIIQEKLGCAKMDRLELNSSSFRGIDTVRELNHVSALCPMGKCRVCILDEVHKMTGDAQHAMLKLLEDTPKSTYFLLCTTNPEKLIRPIRTRCCDVSVGSLARKQLGVLLDRVASSEDVTVGDEHRDMILDASEGSARSMLVLFDRLVLLEAEDWDEVIGTRLLEKSEDVLELCRALWNKAPWPVVTKILKRISEDPESVRWAVLGYASSVLMRASKPRAYLMIDSFSEPFFNTKKAGLVAACYEVAVGA